MVEIQAIQQLPASPLSLAFWSLNQRTEKSTDRAIECIQLIFPIQSPDPPSRPKIHREMDSLPVEGTGEHSLISW